MTKPKTAAKKPAAKTIIGRIRPLRAETKKLTITERLDAIGIESICGYVSSGESLRSWAEKNDMSNKSVIDWIDADADRIKHYARAREERAEHVFESLDDVSNQAVSAETAVEVAGLRLKSDNIKWKLARMNAKKYGDKLAIGGADDMPPIQTITSEMTPQDAARAYAEMVSCKR